MLRARHHRVRTSSPGISSRSSDPGVKQQIRAAAEREEREFYAHRAPPEWLEVLQPLGTDASKPFLETAPWLIAVFIRRFERLADGTKRKHYYTDESVGLATGLLLAAIHHAGLVALTHTPSPMKFLNKILDATDGPRAAIPAAGRWLPGGRRDGSGHPQETAAGNRELRLSGIAQRCAVFDWRPCQCAMQQELCRAALTLRAVTEDRRMVLCRPK